MALPLLTIQHFPKTQEGQALIAEQKPFLLGGEIWQGFKQSLVRVDEMQLTDDELSQAYDVDESRGAILKRRNARLESARMRKEEELAERRAKRRAKERDELELRKLRKELGVDDADEKSEVEQLRELVAKLQSEREHSAGSNAAAIEQYNAPSTVITQGAADGNPLPASPDPGDGRLQCPRCEKRSPAGHRNPKNWLRGHRMSHWAQIRAEKGE